MLTIKRQGIYEVELGATKGSEQGGTRPCLIISNNKGNRYSPTVVGIPITSHKKDFDITHVTIDCLKKESYVLCEQIRNIDKSRIKEYICDLDDISMQEVEEKLRKNMCL